VDRLTRWTARDDSASPYPSLVESAAPNEILSAETEAAIRHAAADALRRSFDILSEERVIPRARYRPWIRMAHDYYGHAVEGSEGALSRALANALPERFEWRQRRGVDLPWYYPSAVLEAAVAAATLADEPYDIASPSVQAVIDGLIDTIQRTPRSTVLRVVSDVEVEHEPVPEGYQDRLGETLEIAGVRVVRVENRPEPFIERELPSAGYEVDRFDVVVHPGPASLIVATVEASADYEARVAEARVRLDRLVAAIRLASAATVRAVIDIAGIPGPLPTVGPAITPLPNWEFRFAHRPVTLGAGDVGGYEALIGLIADWGDAPESVPVRVALGRLARTLDERSPTVVDQIIDLSIGLEAALAGTDRTEIGLRLRSRAAELLAGPNDPADAIYRDVKVLYDLRSTFVHGGTLPAKTVDKGIRRVSGATATDWRAEQYLLAIDRWRDILRRAILARIALTTAATPWIGGATSRLDVDELLLRDAAREAWREHVQEFWASHGLADAPRPATTARLTIGGRSTPKSPPQPR
jgi:hypothetical protein